MVSKKDRKERRNRNNGSNLSKQSRSPKKRQVFVEDLEKFVKKRKKSGDYCAKRH